MPLTLYNLRNYAVEKYQRVEFYRSGSQILDTLATNGRPKGFVIGPLRDWPIHVKIRVQIMNVATVQGNDISVTWNVVERRSQQMWGGNGASVVKVLGFPISLRQSKLREINSGLTPTQSGGAQNTVGKPRHEHDLILRRVRVAEGVTQKLHAPSRS